MSLLFKHLWRQIILSCFFGLFFLSAVLAQEDIATLRLVDSLILAYKKPYPNDSARVEIICKLGKINQEQKYGCVRCIQFLIDNLGVQYFYGDGISDFDQAMLSAASIQIHRYILEEDRDWMVLQYLLDGLKNQERNERYIRRSWVLFCIMSDESISKSIVEFEIGKASEHSMRSKYPFYIKNLELLLEYSK